MTAETAAGPPPVPPSRPHDVHPRHAGAHLAGPHRVGLHDALLLQLDGRLRLGAGLPGRLPDRGPDSRSRARSSRPTRRADSRRRSAPVGRGGRRRPALADDVRDRRRRARREQAHRRPRRLHRGDRDYRRRRRLGVIVRAQDPARDRRAAAGRPEQTARAGGLRVPNHAAAPPHSDRCSPQPRVRLAAPAFLVSTEPRTARRGQGGPAPARRSSAELGRGRRASRSARRGPQPGASPPDRPPRRGRRGRHARGMRRRSAGSGGSEPAPGGGPRRSGRHEHDREHVRHDHRRVAQRPAVGEPQEEPDKRSAVEKRESPLDPRRIRRIWSNGGSPSRSPRGSRRRPSSSVVVTPACPGPQLRLPRPLARLVLGERIGGVHVAERRERRDHVVPAGGLIRYRLPRSETIVPAFISPMPGSAISRLYRSFASAASDQIRDASPP